MCCQLSPVIYGPVVEVTFSAVRIKSGCRVILVMSSPSSESEHLHYDSHHHWHLQQFLLLVCYLEQEPQRTYSFYRDTQNFMKDGQKKLATWMKWRSKMRKTHVTSGNNRTEGTGKMRVNLAESYTGHFTRTLVKGLGINNYSDKLSTRKTVVFELTSSFKNKIE